MNIKRPLLPGFLKKAEQKLLLNHPAIWSTRVHLVLYYGLLTMLVLAGICFINDKDLRANSDASLWSAGFSIISFIALTVWLIYLLRFNVFKKYGTQGALSPLTSFLLYFISVGTIILFPFVPFAVESIKTNVVYSNGTMVNDINDINLKIAQLEYKSLQLRWDHDTLNVVNVEPDDDPEANRPSNSDNVDAEDAPYRRYSYYTVDTVRFKNRIEHLDSVRKIGAHLYVAYSTPDYAFVNPYYRGTSIKNGSELTSFAIYNKVLKGPAPNINRKRVIDELNVLLNKYYYSPYPDFDPNDSETSSGNGPLERISDKYHLRLINDCIDNIEYKKRFWSKYDFPVIIRIFYYVTLVISLLVFMFRHTTVRVFFLSLLTALLITLLSSLVFAFGRFHDQAVFNLLLGYAVLFLFLSFSVWSAKTRKAITGISINFIVVLAPVFPMLCVAWYYTLVRNHVYSHSENTPDFESIVWYAEVGGGLLLLILLATYIGKAYRRWYSLPED